MGIDTTPAATGGTASVPRTAGFSALSFARSFVTNALSQIEGKTVPELSDLLQQLQDNIETERQLADADDAALEQYFNAQRILQKALSKRMAGEGIHQLEAPRNFASVGCSPETVLVEKQSGSVDVLRLIPGANGPLKIKGANGEPTEM